MQTGEREPVDHSRSMNLMVLVNHLPGDMPCYAVDRTETTSIKAIVAQHLEPMLKHHHLVFLPNTHTHLCPVHQAKELTPNPLSSLLPLAWSSPSR